MLILFVSARDKLRSNLKKKLSVSTIISHQVDHRHHISTPSHYSTTLPKKWLQSSQNALCTCIGNVGNKIHRIKRNDPLKVLVKIFPNSKTRILTQALNSHHGNFYRTVESLASSMKQNTNQTRPSGLAQHLPHTAQFDNCRIPNHVFSPRSFNHVDCIRKFDEMRFPLS